MREVSGSRWGSLASLAKMAGLGAVATCTVFCMVLALTRLGPHSSALPLFNSDSAIPVLMANDVTFDPFRLYYYAQDRFGGLPFNLASLARALTTLSWSAENLAVFRTVWLFSSLIFLVPLARPQGGFAVAIFCALALGAPLVRAGLFGCEQVYPWALALLLASWFAIRRHCEATRSPARFALSGGSAFLATWVASSSAPALLALVVVETLRAQLVGESRDGTREAVSGTAGITRAGRWSRVMPLLAVLAGVAAELVMRLGYYFHARAAYGNSFRTVLRFDFGHFAHNASAVGKKLMASSYGTLSLVGFLLGLCAWAVLVWRASRASSGLGAHSGFPRELWDLLVLVAGCVALAGVQCVLLISIAHFRENLFDDRYFTLIEFSLCLGALLGIACALLWAALSWFAERRALAAVRPVLLVVAAISAALVAALSTAPFSRDRSVAELRLRAATVAQRGRGTVLFGNYWDTYVLAGLLPEANLRALPFEGEYLRTPWVVRALRPGVEVVVVTPDGKRDPPEALCQYGATLVRDRAPWQRAGGARFFVYRVDRVAPWAPTAAAARPQPSGR